jgi:uncharacterized protein (DUF433 family)
MSQQSNVALKELAPFETPVAPGIVRRTDRGLCIAGTRVSLYVIMDYLKAGWTPDDIHKGTLLTGEQIDDALRYIENNRESFEPEYAEVVRYSEELERYYRERAPKIDWETPPANLTPEKKKVWEKLRALKLEGKF